MILCCRNGAVRSDMVVSCAVWSCLVLQELYGGVDWCKIRFCIAGIVL